VGKRWALLKIAQKMWSNKFFVQINISVTFIVEKRSQKYWLLLYSKKLPSKKQWPIRRKFSQSGPPPPLLANSGT
jgi:hypothetical protein